MYDAFKAEVIRLINIERKKNGVAELIQMDAVGTIAEIRGKESAELFQHTRPNGTRCFTVFAEHTLRYRAAGENLAYGFKTPAAVVTGWMNSPGHRRNVLDPDFRYIGVGCFTNPMGVLYCATLYYTPRSGK